MSSARQAAIPLFRIVLGMLFMLVPWLFGAGLDGYGLTQLTTGALVIGTAFHVDRALTLRWLCVGLALATFFLPFAFGDAVGETQIYCAVLIGKLFLLTAIISPAVFAADRDPGRTPDCGANARS